MIRSGFHFLRFRLQDDPEAPSALLPTNFVTWEVQPFITYKQRGGQFMRGLSRVFKNLT